MNFFLSCLLRPIYYFSSSQNSIKLAVLWEDIWGVDYIFLNKLQDSEIKKQVVNQLSKDLLIISYNYANTNMAEKLIKIGINFKSEYILYTNKDLSIINIKKHLENIKDLIDQNEIYASDQIIAAHYADSLGQIQNKSCIDCPNIALSITYTSSQSSNESFLSVYESFYYNNKSQSFVIKDVISAIGVSNHLNQKIKIMAPLIKNASESGFYDNQHKLLYSPFYSFNLDEQSIFIHEASHYLMHDQFKNNGKPFPYSNKNIIAAYERASITSLLSVGSIVGFKYDNGLPKTHNSIDVAFDLYFGSLLSFFHFSKVLSTRTLTADERSFVLNEIGDTLRLDDKLITQHGIEPVINKLKIQLIKEFNITTDQLFMLERIGEYITRANEHAYFNELIVRLPEFIVKGLDESALIHLTTLQDYWLENISPTINESINNVGLKECYLCTFASSDELIMAKNISSIFLEEL